MLGVGGNLIAAIPYEWLKIRFLLGGVVLFFILNRYTNFPNKMYIFFHEVSHVISAVFFSAKIFEFKVTANAGYIKSDKNNIVIRLAPYLLPLMSYVVLVIHFLFLIYMKHYHNSGQSSGFTFFMIGFFYSTTCYYNVKLIAQGTSDIDREELLLSLLLIFNCFFLSSSLLFFLLFHSETLVEKFYFIPSFSS